MTRNFQILLDYKFKKDQEKILNNIKQIENNVKDEKNYILIFSLARKTLEIMLHNIFYTNEENTLDKTIHEICNYYPNPIPSKVKNAFYYIKQKGNESIHRIKNTDKPYVIENDIFVCIELLKNLFIVIKFCLIKDNQNDILDLEDYNFNSEIYFSNKNVEKKFEDENVSIDKSGMESNTKGLFQLLTTNYKFFIPTYQREYSWSKENIEVFLQDIEDRNIDKKKHYMGSLAIAIDKKNKTIRLIDGQQRITTTLILIKAIINIFKERKSKIPVELEKIAKNINEIYANKNCAGELNNVFKILSNETIDSRYNFKNSIAKSNYDLIYEFFNGKTINQINELLTTFIHYFVIAELTFKNNIENEIQIFENLNSKGLELSQWDLVKNYIYKKIDFEVLINNESKVEKIISNLFIDPATTSFGKKKNKELSEFLIFYSRIKYKSQTNKELTDKGKVHKIFAKVWNNNNKKFTSLESVKNSLIKIARYFKIFLSLKEKEYLDSDNKFFNVRVYLKNLQKKESSLMPLIMNIIHENTTWNENEIIEIKELPKIFNYIISIEKYVTRLLVVSNVGQSLSIFWDSLISNDIFKSYKLFENKIKKPGLLTTLPTHKSFKKELKNKDNWQKEYALNVLRILEFGKTNKKSGRYEVLIKPTLEHIFPIKLNPNSYWRNINKNLTNEDFESQKNSRINKLGNYIILNSKLNIKASNKSFFEKLVEYEKDSKNIFIKGFENNQLMNLFNEKTFNFEQIDKRTEQLANLIAPLYKFEWEIKEKK